MACSRWLPFGVQYLSSWRTAIERFDHVHQPLYVRLGRITLKRCRLDAIDRQCHEERRFPAKRVAVAADNRAIVLLDEAREFVEIGRRFARLRGIEAYRLRFLLLATDRLFACHMVECQGSDISIGAYGD